MVMEGWSPYATRITSFVLTGLTKIKQCINTCSSEPAAEALPFNSRHGRSASSSATPYWNGEGCRGGY